MKTPQKRKHSRASRSPVSSSQSPVSAIQWLPTGSSAARLLVRGKPLLMLGGELHNSSASSLAYLAPILPRLRALNLNTVLAPVSWELLEPKEGHYDFSLVDGMIRLARKHRLHLVPLWFGTMKNAMSSYAPPWVLTDLQRFPRAHTKPGENAGVCSVFEPEVLRCDARAFAALMRRIHQLDHAIGTVPFVQVENEVGLLGSPRDLSPAAEKAFHGQVPQRLLAHLRANRAGLAPDLAACLPPDNAPPGGSWAEVFGAWSDEVFMAWHMARFVDEVAAAGRAEHDVPMVANAWLQAGPGYLPGQYPSGGPVDRMLEVWQVAAPHLAALAPDIYAPDFRHFCEAYQRAGNALVIPEARPGAVAAAQALYAVGRHHALLYSPFGIDDLQPDHPLGEAYKTLAGLAPLLLDAFGTPRMTGFLQQADEERWSADVGAYRFNARTVRKLADVEVPGSALLLQLDEHEFVAVGQNLIFTFDPLTPGLRTAAIVHLDVGTYRNGRWIPGRRLNGDETYAGTGVLLTNTLTVQRFRLHAHP